MARRHARGGIERKFLTSIIWVGVIPMALALVIGYVFAREGQQIAVRQELDTAVRTTAGGVWTTLQLRLQFAEHVASDPVLIQAVEDYRAGRTPDREAVIKRFPSEPVLPNDIPPAYALFDPAGKTILSGQRYDFPARTLWRSGVTEATYTGFGYIGDVGRYAHHILVPIRSDGGTEILGYLAVVQGVQDLLEYALGRGASEESITPDSNNYELIFVGEGREFVVYFDENDSGAAPPPRFDVLDQRLAERIRRNPDTSFDSFTQWRYQSRGTTMPALMAYHRLSPQENLYLLVYRGSGDVFANINLAAVLTLLVSSLVIGLFCIIAYRIVNNNIIRPVSLLNEGAQIVRQGDLELKLKIDTGDEIEELAHSFNKMALALRENIYALEASEERYRSLFTSMRDGIFQTDPDGMITLINPAGAEILGYENFEAVTGAYIRDLFIEEIDYARVNNELDRNRYIERTRVWMKKAGASSICVELVANRVFDARGEYIGMEGTFRDVTQNVRLEQDARERSERIAAINKIANAINSSLEAGRVYESIVIEVRKLVTFDYAAVSLLDEDSGDFDTLQLWPEPPEDTPRPLRKDGEGSCAAAVATSRECLIVPDLRGENPIYQGQFTEGMVSCICVPLYATGRIIGTLNLASRFSESFTRHEMEVLQQMAPHVAVAIRNAKLLENLQHSLEEVTRAREKLHEVNEELKTLDEMKTNLLSNVSHELRTPLVAVMGYTDMILNSKVGPINDVQEEYLGISLRNIEKLVTLIENLLDFSRLHRGDEDLLFDTFDLVDCARTSMQIVQPVADAKGIALIIKASTEPVLVEGDKGKLGQVFNNLLSNAVKFNGPEGSVTIDLMTNDADVDVKVTDTGIGIPDDARDKIFTRFYQVDSSSTRKYGGTGIGLAIAQDIMRLHGSSIGVTSEMGKGTCFRFVLPLSPSQRTSGEGESPTPPLPTETHLLVELVTQDRAMSGQIRGMLLSEGMDMIHAAYPAVAISLANKYSPDCILVDSEAGPLGSVVIDEILADPSVGNLPIVLLTNDDGLYRSYEERVSGRVKRSFRKSTLLSGIHYALSKGVPEGEQLGNKVLCVDDDQEIGKFIARCLEAEGFETERCGSGEEALERIQSRDYWLVLLDIAMPGMDGWETCKRLRADGSLTGLRIYMVTAKPMERSIAKVHEGGADGYLQKPFKAEDLLALLDGFEWRRYAGNARADTGVQDGGASGEAHPES